MRILFLGTAAAEGIPGMFCQCDLCMKAKKLGGHNIRTRSSILIDYTLKIDLPPDNYLHLTKYNLDFSRISHIFITHSHQDHFYPEDLRLRYKPFAHMRDANPLYVYGNERVISSVKEVIKGKEDKVIIPVQLEPFKEVRVSEDCIVIPLLADHDINETCFIYLIKINGFNILHGYDSGWFPDKTWDFLKKYRLDVVILDCTCAAKDCSKYHMGINCLLKVKEKMINEGMANGKTIFVATHFSHNGGLLHEELERILEPKGVIPAYDGLMLKL